MRKKVSSWEVLGGGRTQLPLGNFEPAVIRGRLALHLPPRLDRLHAIRVLPFCCSTLLSSGALSSLLSSWSWSSVSSLLLLSCSCPCACLVLVLSLVVSLSCLVLSFLLSSLVLSCPAFSLVELLGASCGASWGSCGASWGFLRVSWSFLEASWGPLGRLLGPLGGVLGPLGGLLGASWNNV